MTADDFFTRYAPGLTDRQREAVQAGEGAHLVLAVPGSGKTTVLILRLGYLILVRGISPEKTLTMTYTKAATNEMRERFRGLFGSEYADRLEFRTINGVSSRIISFYSKNCSKNEPFPLCEDENRLNAYVRSAYSGLTGDYADDATVKDLRSAITYAKNMMLSEDEIAELKTPAVDFHALYTAYCGALLADRMMDYDDQMVYAHTILQRFRQVLAHFREAYPYISVDEAQDTSRIQHAIIALLAGRDGNIFMVGDEDQSIYGFRAAYPEALLSFGETYSGAAVIKMEENYRSATAITDAANRFIAGNKDRYEKVIRPTRAETGSVSVIPCSCRETQYRMMAELIRREKDDCAVLYRNNDCAVPLIDILERENIPYSIRKFDTSFFTSRAVTDAADIISFAFDQTDTERFLRIYYKIGTRLTRAEAQTAAAIAKRTGANVLSTARNALPLGKYVSDAVGDVIHDLEELKISSAKNAVIIIRQRLGYTQYLERSGIDSGKLDVLTMLAEYQKDAPALLRRLDELHGLAAGRTEDPRGGVTLSTIHSAKGLEFKKVYLIDVFDGVLPSVSADADPDQYAGERRLFYVAMTRAKDELRLLSSSRGSEFISEVMSTLPFESFDPGDALFGAAANRVGRRYDHRSLGVGKVAAQADDRHLIAFSGGKYAFLSLSEMLENRKKRFSEPRKARQAPEVPDSPSDFVRGSAVSHSTFGDGEVLSVTDGIALIRFSRDSSERRIVLRPTVQNGYLKLKKAL